MKAGRCSELTAPYWRSSCSPASAPARSPMRSCSTRIENEKKAGKRLETIKAAETDRSVVKAARDRVAEAAKRRKSVQDSLKELDEKQKTKDQRRQEAAAEGPDSPGRPAGFASSASTSIRRVCGVVADGRSPSSPARRCWSLPGVAVGRRARPAALVRLVSPRAPASRHSSTNFRTRSTSSCARSSPACRSTTPSA